MSETTITQSCKQILEGTHNHVLTAIGQRMKDDNIIFQMPPSNAHIMWLTGHLAWSRDFIVNQSLGKKAVIPELYSELFAFGTTPVDDISHYPPFEEVLENLKAAHQSTMARLGELNDEQLADEIPEESPMRQMFLTYQALLFATPFHEGYHAGQIGLLRRAQGLESGFGM